MAENRKVKQWKSKEYGLIKYESVKSFRKNNVEGGYLVAGAIGEGIKGEAIGTWLLEGNEKKYYALKYSRIRYEIDGYFEIEEGKYIVVIRSKLKKILLWALLLLLLLVMILWFKSQFLNGPDIDGGSSKYQPNVEFSENMDPNRIAIPGFSNIKMESQTNTAYIAMWNPETNPCYFKFKIILDTNSSVIYESKLIPPGQAVTEIRFNQNFDEGIYPVTIEISSYDLNDHKKQMNGGQVKSQIVSLANVE